MTTETTAPESAPQLHPPTVPVDYQYEVAIINEECAEVGQIVGKIFRFGWASHNPDTGRANYDLLHDEMGDVEAAIEFGVKRGAFDRKKIAQAKKEKLAKLKSVAPPAMRVTSGSTLVHHQNAHNESRSAIIVMAFMVALLVLAFLFGRSMGDQEAKEESRIDTTVAAQECYAAAIAKIPPGKAAKPADVSTCDALATQAQ